MTEVTPKTPRHSGTAVDVFVLVSHLAIGTVAAFGEKLLHFVPQLWLRIIILLLYVGIAWLAFRKLRKNQLRAEHINAEQLQEQLDHERKELATWRRFWLLNSRMLKVVGQFLKNRYRLNHTIARRFDACGDSAPLTSFISIMEDFDKERRAHVKDALAQVSNDLVDDSHDKPTAAEVAVRDLFKVSFYSVETDPDTGELCLLKKWRFYPNEGEPKTPKFHFGEGAAGLAWEKKRVIVCEKGAPDSAFKVMWDGQGNDYASMICVPAMKDMPADKISEVYGVLTVHTPVREGYFGKQLEQFWADLYNPLCDLLVYLEESEQLVAAVKKAAKALTENQGSADGA